MRGFRPPSTSSGCFRRIETGTFEVRWRKRRGEKGHCAPSRRRVCIDHVRSELKVSERRVCRVLGQHRSTQRRVPTGPDDEDRLTADIVQLARQYGRYGYRKIDHTRTKAKSPQTNGIVERFHKTMLDEFYASPFARRSTRRSTIFRPTSEAYPVVPGYSIPLFGPL
jgi:hypothetical protein